MALVLDAAIDLFLDHVKVERGLARNTVEAYSLDLAQFRALEAFAMFASDLDPASQPGSYEGIVAYSKICTHVGCPVALYEQQTHHLLCPCHQSTFDVLDGGTVLFGPAARALPQLPIRVDADGTLRSGGTMSDFVGPDAWETG